MRSDVYLPLHGADNRMIKVLFCGELYFAAVQWLRLWLIVGQDYAQLNAGTQQRLLFTVL